MADKPAKANIQGAAIHLVKINNNGLKDDCSILDRRKTGGGAASSTDPDKRADKWTVTNADRQIDMSTVEKNMHEHMTPDETWIGF